MTIVARAMNSPRGARSSEPAGSAAFGRGASAGDWSAARTAVWAGATTGSVMAGTGAARRPPSWRLAIAVVLIGATRAAWTPSTDLPEAWRAGCDTGTGACLVVPVVPPLGAG